MTISFKSLYCISLALQFQENLLKTMVAIEDTYFSLAETCKRNCLVICDRGTMDAAACKFANILANTKITSVERYISFIGRVKSKINYFK